MPRRRILGLGVAASAGAALSYAPVLAQESATAARSPGNRIITAGPGGQFDDPQAAIDSITDSSFNKRYVVLLLPGAYTLTETLALNGSNGGPDGGKDYISLIGVDPESCIVSRPTSPGTLSPVIQAANNCRIANVTVTSRVSRLIHWDTTLDGSSLTIENCYFPEGGGANGVSTGMNGASRLRVASCEFGQAHCGVHNASGGAPTPAGRFEFIGNVMTMNSHLGIDMTAGDSSLEVHIAGNSLTGSGELVRIDVNDESRARLVVYTDNISGGSFRNPRQASRFWNRILFPQTRPLSPATADLVEGAIAAVRFATDGSSVEVGTTSTHGDLYPVVVVERSSPDASIRVATGAYAEVSVGAGIQISPNDVIVTSTTPGQATVDNSQTDARRILGYALTPHGGDGAGRIVVRLNRILGL